MSQLISEIISTGGRELEREDEFQQWFFGSRGEAGGVLRIKLPCWRQYVFGRAILPKYHADLQFHNNERCFAELEVKFERKKYLFVMEKWQEGEPQAPLTEAVDRLAKSSADATLLVFSANPFGQTEEFLRRIDGLPGVEGRSGVHRFPTKNDKDEDYEFWVGGWRVASRRSAATGRRAFG
jgi:hypothetical protein